MSAPPGQGQFELVPTLNAEVLRRRPRGRAERGAVDLDQHGDDRGQLIVVAERAPAEALALQERIDRDAEALAGREEHPAFEGGHRRHHELEVGARVAQRPRGAETGREPRLDLRVRLVLRVAPLGEVVHRHEPPRAAGLDHLPVVAAEPQGPVLEPRHLDSPAAGERRGQRFLSQALGRSEHVSTITRRPGIRSEIRPGRRSAAPAHPHTL